MCEPVGIKFKKNDFIEKEEHAETVKVNIWKDFSFQICLYFSSFTIN